MLLKKDVALKFLDPVIIKDEKKFLRVKREINTFNEKEKYKNCEIEYLSIWAVKKIGN